MQNEIKSAEHNLQYPSGSVEDEGLKKISYCGQANTVIQDKESKYKLYNKYQKLQKRIVESIKDL